MINKSLDKEEKATEWKIKHTDQKDKSLSSWRVILDNYA